MVNKRKILYVTGTRADFGLMTSVLDSINNHPSLDLEVVATGMHLMREFGHTIDDVVKRGYKVHTVNVTYEKDDSASMLKFLGEFIQKFTVKLGEIKPDVVVVLGDRSEMLGAAIAGAYLSIPVAHVSGGDLSASIDGIVRHAITKLSHLHFPLTEKSAERVIKMGENPERVHVAGSTGTDTFSDIEFVSKEALCEYFDFDPKKPVLAVLQHPVTTESDDSARQMTETMNAVTDLGLQSVVVYPCADAGGRKMVEIIERHRFNPRIRIYKNLERPIYLNLLKNADVLVGNSSSGLVETPYFHLPTVNIGTRQSGRERAENVINAKYDAESIIAAIKTALYDDNFKALAENCKNPYDCGNAGEIIAGVLGEVEINAELLQKTLTY